MFVLLLLVLLISALLLLYIVFKTTKWILVEKVRVKWAISILIVLVLGFAIKKVFFTNMEFIQSNVYSNLYIVKDPVKNKVQLKDAILYKIKNHLKTEHKQPKKLSYSKKMDCIYFYNDGGMTFGFIGEAGTAYFIDHEEDLGGFVSEELGMYQEYRLAAFYYEPSINDTKSICGELDFFHEGKFVKTDTLVIKID